MVRHTLSALLVIFLMSNAKADPSRGLCSLDTTGPGLASTTCYFPSCPSGIDCLPPEINKTSASISFGEPMMRWQDICENKQVIGACWEVLLEFNFKLAATDPSGVTAVGVHLYTETSAKRIFKLFWSGVQNKDAQGKYGMAGIVRSLVPPGQRLEVGVYEICSRDARNNEGCVVPMRGGRDLSFRLGETTGPRSGQRPSSSLGSN